MRCKVTHNKMKIMIWDSAGLDSAGLEAQHDLEPPAVQRLEPSQRLNKSTIKRSARKERR